MEHSLSQRLIASAEPDDEATFFQLKELLGMAAGGLANDGTLPTDPKLASGFRMAQRCLFELRRGRLNLREDGILYKGRPDFLTDALLSSLQHELDAQQAHAVRDRWQQHLSTPGPVAHAVANHPELRKLVTGLAGPVLEQVTATCLFYDVPGAEIRPHVDVDQFCVNANLIVSHTAERERASSFVLYPVGGEPQCLSFEDGELLLFYADCIVHARTPITAGERVRAVSLGFRPAGELHYDEV